MPTDRKGRRRIEKYKIPKHAFLNNRKAIFQKQAFPSSNRTTLSPKPLRAFHYFFAIFFISLFFFKVNHKSPIIQVLHSPILTGIFFGMSYKTDKHLSYSPEMSKINYEKLHPRYQVCGDNFKIIFHLFFYLYRVNRHVIHKHYTKEVRVAVLS